MDQPPWKTVLVISYKIKHSLTGQFSSHAPWYVPKGAENYVHTKTCTQTFLAALFTTVKT